MQISDKAAEFSLEDWPEPPGYHDVTWLDVTSEGIIFPVEGTSWGVTRFLVAVAEMVGDHDFRSGTVYCNVVANDVATPGGRFHYDTGADHPIEGHEVTRFVLAWSSDCYPVGTVYSSDPGHLGMPVDALFGSGRLIQPANGRLVRHEEGTDLHGLLSSPARPGSVTVFVSATLYRATQVPDLGCPALRPLRTDSHLADPRFMRKRGLI